MRLQSSYEEAISNVLSLGGDTDTNAAIVGGLMGALHGQFGFFTIHEGTNAGQGFKQPWNPNARLLDNKHVAKGLPAAI